VQLWLKLLERKLWKNDISYRICEMYFVLHNHICLFVLIFFLQFYKAVDDMISEKCSIVTVRKQGMYYAQFGSDVVHRQEFFSASLTLATRHHDSSSRPQQTWEGKGWRYQICENFTGLSGCGWGKVQMPGILDQLYPKVFCVLLAGYSVTVLITCVGVLAQRVQYASCKSH